MEIAKLVTTTLLDYPNRVAAVAFTSGCNFRCPFCHNADLVLPEKARELSLLPEEEVLATVAERRELLDGLVITGGEPTLQPDLESFVRKAKTLGLLVKLDTNGSRPDVLEGLLDGELLDYVAMDVKAPFARYAEFAGVRVTPTAIARSIGLVRRKAPEHEFRTTVAPGLGIEDLRAIADLLRGAGRWVLQSFVVPSGKGLVNPEWAARAGLSRSELDAAWDALRDRFPDGGVR